MLKSSSVNRKRKQSIHRRSAILYKTRICIRVDPKRRQGNNYLRAALHAFAVHTGKRPVRFLQFRKAINRLIHRRIHISSTGFIIRGKRLQHHTGHIRISLRTIQRPAAVRCSLFQNMADQPFPRGLCFSRSRCRYLITMAVKCNQCKSSSVDSLPACLFKISKRRQQIISSYVCHIFPKCSKRQHDTGILCILFFVQYTIILLQHFQQICLVPLNNRRIHFLTTSYKTKNMPFSVDRAHLRHARLSR